MKNFNDLYANLKAEKKYFEEKLNIIQNVKFKTSINEKYILNQINEKYLLKEEIIKDINKNLKKLNKIILIAEEALKSSDMLKKTISSKLVSNFWNKETIANEVEYLTNYFNNEIKIYENNIKLIRNFIGEEKPVKNINSVRDNAYPLHWLCWPIKNGYIGLNKQYLFDENLMSKDITLLQCFFNKKNEYITLSVNELKELIMNQ